MYVRCICYNSHTDTLTAFMVRRTYRRRRNFRRRPIRRFRRRPMRYIRRRTRRVRRRFRRGEKVHFKTRRLVINANINSSESGNSDGIMPLLLEPYFQPWEYTELRAWFDLFEFFRVNAVVLKFTPNRTVNSSWYTGSGTNSSSIPMLHWCVDRDDISTFADSSTGLDYIQAKPSYKSALFDRPISMKIRPNILSPVFLDALSQGVVNPEAMIGAPRFKQWVSTKVYRLPLNEEGELQYYGIRAMFTFPPTTAGNSTFWPYTIQAKMYISFKNKKYIGDPT